MYTNRLVHEKSPYLLQHAHNPVDWHPWGQEAFDKARSEDKPIFLSVGYSTCHWCHVMERESFESESTARLLNEYFVPVKVDRDETPDIDRIYMTFVQASTGGGGWPMSVWLTPDLKPFFGGTYFPPVNAYGRIGFPAILERLAEAWKSDRARIAESAASVIRQLEEHVRTPARGAAAPDASVLDAGYQMFHRGFDPRRGGFGGPPKFPRPVTHNFLLRYYARSGNEEALDMVLKTLREMAAGGINDQLGGGFHRYSVDERWFVPHFEKMLYDQAQLAVSYVEAFQITRDPFFAGVARDTLEYVLRDMTHPEGAFYSAEDADSVIDPDNPEVKGEGAFYVWSHEEITRLVGRPRAEWFCYRYGVIPEGNVDPAHDPHHEFTGKNILYQARSVKETAARYGRPFAEVEAGLAEAGRTLFEARGRRIRPHLDDKVLTAWNGLMISAFSAAAQALGEGRYAEAARRSADFVLGRMYHRGERLLMRRHRDGETAIPGFLDDYALFAGALFDVYEVTFDCRYLETAVELAEVIVERFEDRERGGFFSAAEGDGSLVLRIKDDYDGAEPSGNAAAMTILLRAGWLTGRADFRDAAGRALASFAAGLRSAPVTVPQMLVALDMSLSTPRQIVLATDGDGREMLEFRREIGCRFLPYRTLLAVNAASRERLAALQPAVREMAATGGKTAAYVCRNYVCQLPVSDVGALRELLQ